MSDKTKIEWTDATWNPIWGCSVVSPGCHNCYAAGVASRFPVPGKFLYAATRRTGKPAWTGEAHVIPAAMYVPLRWTKPRKVFVCSMSDLFQDAVPIDVIETVFGVMAACPHLTFQVLTKRAARMRAVVADMDLLGVVARATFYRPNFDSKAARWPLPNVWLGVSVEDQARAKERLPDLIRTPAAVRFVSAEPLLGYVSLSQVVGLNLGGHIDWVIAGGESGTRARPCRAEWVRDLRNECQSFGVPFFFKQWGEWLPSCQDGAPGPDQELNCSDGPIRVGKKAAGSLLDGAIWNEFPDASGETR